MKIGTLPDGAMLLINPINKRGYTYISPNNFSKRNPDDEDFIDENKPPYNLSGDDLKNFNKYVSEEIPSGVRGRLYLLSRTLNEADAYIILGKRPKNYKRMYGVLNELILFGGSGCANEHKLALKMINEKDIPKLIVKHPRSSDELVDLISRVNCFLDNIETYLKQNIILNDDSLSVDLSVNEDKYSLDELKDLINNL